MEDDITRIVTWLQPEEILLDVDVRDRQHALEIVAAAIGRSHGLDPTPILHALWRREQAESTALGDGFAIPHARIDGIARPITVFMRTKLAVAFGAPDGKPVSCLMFILVPTDGSKDDHLKLLALIARLFSDRGFRAKLDGAPDAGAAAGVFRAGAAQVTTATSSPCRSPSRAGIRCEWKTWLLIQSGEWHWSSWSPAARPPLGPLAVLDLLNAGEAPVVLIEP